MRLRGAAILAVLTAFAPACGGGGSGGAASPLVFTPLVPVDTSGATQIVDTTQANNVITAQLQGFLNLGGMIVFNNVGTTTIALTAQLDLPASKTAIIDGKGTIKLSGSSVRPILTKHDDSDLTVQRLEFIDGRAATEGGAIRGQQNGFLTVIDCQFTNCSTTATEGPDIGGGGIRLVNDRWLQVSGSTFTNCDGPNGGAIDTIGTRITLINCTFTLCNATGTGGGADQGITGKGGIGGAVYVDGVSQHSFESRLDIAGCTFTNNSAEDHGGALFAYTIAGTGSSVLIDQSTFSNNSLTDLTPAVGMGGAVYHQNGAFTVTRSTFDGNGSNAVKQGGGIASLNSSGTIENSTFQGNKANGNPGFGGALRLYGAFLINSCTIAENQAAGWGGGIFVAGSASGITLSNSLLMDNTGTDLGNGWNINVTLSHGSNNLQWPTTRGVAGPADTPARPSITFANAALGALADNGGPTRTRAITGGPAVNAGNTSAPDTDQRGTDRAGTPDIGAFEKNP